MLDLLFLKISQNSQENTCASLFFNKVPVSFLIQPATKKLLEKLKTKNSKHARFTILFWEIALKNIAMKQIAC